jgi:hypothetical protein
MENGNSAFQQVSFDPLANLLRQAAPEKAADLDAILSRLQPICELDRQSERILFQARPSPCTIRIGIECTRRLQAHAYAAGIFFSTPGCLEMGIEECRKLYAPADHLLNWAVSRELQQSLKLKGMDVSLDDLLAGLGKELPDDILSSLNETQRLFGDCLFRFAIAFILLHELAHLEYRHTFCEGYWSIQQENDADRFAADWLLEGASRSTKAPQSNCCHIPVGIAVALLWLTIHNIFLGPRQTKTHPEGYNRLFQIVEHTLDADDQQKSSMVWEIVARLLCPHMATAKIELDPARMQGNPKDEVNYMIDVISKKQSW